VHFGVEGGLDGGGGAGELDEAAGLGDLGDGEAGVLQPGGDLRDVRGSGAEELAEGPGGHPLVVAGAALVLLGVEEGVEGVLLRVGTLEGEEHVLEQGAGGDAADVGELAGESRMAIGTSDESGVVDLLDNAGLRAHVDLRCGSAGGRKRDGGDKRESCMCEGGAARKKGQETAP